MRIIKLDATDSTNTFLRQLSGAEKLDDYTIVTTDSQTNGRGQMGTIWKDSPGENLIFSVFKDVSFVDLNHQFYISIVTSLAIYKTLSTYEIPKIFIKWPNDILSENKKICGVLIENVVKKSTLKGAIIGIGLNVNQSVFDNLPKASSLKKITSKSYHIEELLLGIIQNMRFYFDLLKHKEYHDLKKQYETYLFRKNKPSTFQDAEGCMFSGYIKGVSNSGNLQVILEDAIVKEFDLKEITLLY